MLEKRYTRSTAALKAERNRKRGVAGRKRVRIRRGRTETGTDTRGAERKWARKRRGAERKRAWNRGGQNADGNGYERGQNGN